MGTALGPDPTNQEYLALLEDLLGRTSEALTLVRMDDTRRPDVYRLLRGISPRRQVLLMTCHSWIADEAGRELKARRIDLAG